MDESNEILSSIYSGSLRFFKNVFPNHPFPPVIAAAPGAISLIGEYTERQDGFQFSIGIDRHAVVAVAPTTDGVYRVFSNVYKEMKSFSLQDIENPTPNKLESGWWLCIIGVLRKFFESAGIIEMKNSRRNQTEDKRVVHNLNKFHRYRNSYRNACEGSKYLLKGVDIMIISNVPIGVGLNSSSAVAVACATALEMVTGYILRPMEKAVLCQLAEAEWASVTSRGLMGAVACTCCEKDHALLLDFRTLLIQQYLFPVEQIGILLVISGLKMKRKRCQKILSQREAECSEAMAALRRSLGKNRVGGEQKEQSPSAEEEEKSMEIEGEKATMQEAGDKNMKQGNEENVLESLRDVKLSELKAAKSLMSEKAYNRAFHVIEENRRCLSFAEYIRTGKIENAGELMSESHNSLKELFGVTVWEIDLLVDVTKSMKGVYGTKMTGRGFGGGVVVLVKKEFRDEVSRSIFEKFYPLYHKRKKLMMAKNLSKAKNEASKQGKKPRSKFLTFLCCQGGKRRKQVEVEREDPVSTEETEEEVQQMLKRGKKFFFPKFQVIEVKPVMGTHIHEDEW